jgi:hypothetical protein
MPPERMLWSEALDRRYIGLIPGLRKLLCLQRRYGESLHHRQHGRRLRQHLPTDLKCTNRVTGERSDEHKTDYYNDISHDEQSSTEPICDEKSTLYILSQSTANTAPDGFTRTYLGIGHEVDSPE